MAEPKSITIPAAVDLHVHFREPSTNKAETIDSGSKAAALGGYGLVCDMPNNPGNPTWTMEKLTAKQAIIKKSSYIPIATYTGSQPESDNLAELPKMAAKSIGLKLYGAATTGNFVDYDPAAFDKIVAAWHKAASAKPIMLHSGKDNLAEFISLITGRHSHPLHICHVNSAADVKLVEQARETGAKISCGVCPHHIFKSESDVRTQGWFARMQPPLVDEDSAAELFKLFATGEIDVLETDHAPHLTVDKWAAELENPDAIHDPNHRTCFGVPGIEFALPLLFYQMSRGRINLDRIIDATSKKPAKIIGVKLSPTTKVTWRLEKYRVGDKYPKGLSGSGWTPYMNNLAVGIVEKSVVGGKTLIENGKLIARLSQVANSGSVV
ncbi:hypothetical protein A3F65_01450 [Candidatus Saccharibacteria bacterium RIFCSPHIGHO2_12_FULL_47_16b]|nr:MAG: hypothetical protein A3F65_01450 [Candidatus Saccharibacteria bacterium RIFCSPHIGHO2_12_FULL_47_16b]OGL39084.1 MAG: hypothetical protein A3J32_01510 [Candidatus Saccharibacteria bacterium RIFCSPLOWO2_02_FULL_46_7]